MNEVVFVQTYLAPVEESPSLAATQPLAGVLLWKCRYCRKTWRESFGDAPYESRKKFCSRRCCRDSDYAKNKDIIRKRAKDAYYADLGLTREKERERYILHKKRLRVSRRKTWNKYKAAWNEKRAYKHKLKYHELKLKVFLKYDNKCAICGEKRIPVLSIDHVNGDGARHRRECSCSLKRFNEILLDTSGKFQILCMNCQWMKRHINGETKKPRLLLGAAEPTTRPQLKS